MVSIRKNIPKSNQNNLQICSKTKNVLTFLLFNERYILISFRKEKSIGFYKIEQQQINVFAKSNLHFRKSRVTATVIVFLSFFKCVFCI